MPSSTVQPLGVFSTDQLNSVAADADGLAGAAEADELAGATDAGGLAGAAVADVEDVAGALAGVQPISRTVVIARPPMTRMP